MPFIEERIRITTDRCFLGLKNQGNLPGARLAHLGDPVPLDQVERALRDPPCPARV